MCIALIIYLLHQWRLMMKSEMKKKNGEILIKIKSVTDNTD